MDVAAYIEELRSSLFWEGCFREKSKQFKKRKCEKVNKMTIPTIPKMTIHKMTKIGVIANAGQFFLILSFELKILDQKSKSLKIGQKIKSLIFPKNS